MLDEQKSKEEEEIKNFCQGRAAKKLEKVAKFLESVALDDKRRDTVSVKVKVMEEDGKGFHYDYEDREVAIPINVRVQAAKTWKELIADKAIGDIKEKAKDNRRTETDMKKACEAIAKMKMAERVKADEDIPLE